MEIALLKDILTIFGISLGGLYACHRLRVPTTVGFLFTGLLAGPHGLGLVKVQDAIEILAEVGVVLLLFTIGLEFSLRSFLQIRKLVLVGGSSQVFLTFLATVGIARAFDLPPAEAVFLGFLLSLSSTAIVMKILQEKAEVETPHGSATLGILIFQDIIVVPMMLFTPLLAGTEENLTRAFLIFIGEGVGIVLFVYAGVRWVVPWILYKVTQTRIRELFLLSVITICLVIAWITHAVGLSLALGAFLAGLIISESEYSHQAIGNILPFRDVFASFFFVSVGMLLDIRFVIQNAAPIALIALCILSLKSLIAGFSTAIAGLPFRTLVLVGMALSQVGEFSFILSKAGVEYGLLQEGMYQMFLAVSVLSMAATPFIMGAAPLTADLLLKLPIPPRLKRGSYLWRGTPQVHETDHVIIIGFGVNGRNLARASKAAGIPYLVIEMNPEVVRDERSKGEPVFYGDATQEAVLQHAGIREARAVVAVINDPAATRRVTVLARRLNPKVHLIVRTRFLREMEPLYALGANEVIPEEYETSVEIFARLLRKYLLPREEIEKFISEIRSEGYEMFRTISRGAASCLDLAHCLPDVEIAIFRVGKEAPIVGKSLIQTEMRRRHGITLLAMRRGSQLIYELDPEAEFRENDLLVFIGPPEKLAGAASLFRGEEGGTLDSLPPISRAGPEDFSPQ
jgi:CPA2 family monovalent cation:H+ antiporter-2